MLDASAKPSPAAAFFGEAAMNLPDKLITDFVALLIYQQKRQPASLRLIRAGLTTK